MMLRSLPWLALVCCVAGCPKNRCPERVDALKSIAIDLRDPRVRTPTARVYVAELKKGAGVEVSDSKTPEIAVVGKPDEKIEGATAIPALRALHAMARLKLCTFATELKLDRAKAADPEERDRALALVKTVPAEDRASVLAAELSDAHICKIEESIAVLANVAPVDKETILAASVAEQLEDCGCPRKDAERAFALTTLILDTWDYAGDCVSVRPTRDAEAPEVVIGESAAYGDVIKALRAYEGQPVRLR